MLVIGEQSGAKGFARASRHPSVPQLLLSPCPTLRFARHMPPTLACLWRLPKSAQHRAPRANGRCITVFSLSGSHAPRHFGRMPAV